LKIAFSSMGKGLKAQLSSRFGRCPYFVIIDINDMQVENLQNTGVNALNGAGIQAAQILVNKNVNAIISGKIGPKAFQVLKVAGIKFFMGKTGKISDLLELYKRGELKEIELPTELGRRIERKGYRRI